MNFLVEQTDWLLQAQGFEYAFCGGWAIDLFLGKESRKHHDIDILVYWPDRDKIILHMQSLGFEVYEMLGGGQAHHITNIHIQSKSKRNIFCCKDDCDFVQFTKTDKSDIFNIDFTATVQTKLDYVEFLFNDKTSTDFLYARNHEIKRSLNRAILFACRIPYLAPEICLLYKSTDIEREGYQHDYDKAICRMSADQKQWLNSALAIQYPQGHPWRT